MPRFNRDFQFLFNTAVASLMVMALLFTIKPYVSPADPLKDEIRAFAGYVVRARVDEIETLLRHPDGRPTMMVVYASWCGYCRQLMPSVVKLAQDDSLDLHFLLLSVDHDPMALSSYFVRNKWESLFTAYIVTQHRDFSLKDGLARLGSRYEGQIPYIAFFDGKGRMLGELSGVTHPATLREAAEKAASLPLDNL